MDSMMFGEERKNILIGIRPKFSERESANDKSEVLKKDENKQKLKDHHKKGKKRMLRRVVRERKGSMSSASSLESYYMTEKSIAPSERNDEEESLIEEIPRETLEVRLDKTENPPAPLDTVQKAALYGASDAFT